MNPRCMQLHAITYLIWNMALASLQKSAKEQTSHIPRTGRLSFSSYTDMQTLENYMVFFSELKRWYL